MYIAQLPYFIFHGLSKTIFHNFMGLTVYLQEDLHAPIFLLGLTITTGAVVSIPFLYYSDNIVKKVSFILKMKSLQYNKPFY